MDREVWTIAQARDNSLQVVLGIGKYTNRGVFDGAAGVWRGTEQWTVRAGRRLSSDPRVPTSGRSNTSSSSRCAPSG